MINLIKADLYKNLKCKFYIIYPLTVIGMFLLYLSSRTSNFVNIPTIQFTLLGYLFLINIFWFSPLFSSILFDSRDRKNNLYSTMIESGYSRNKILIIKYIEAFFSTILLLVILGFSNFIFSIIVGAPLDASMSLFIKYLMSIFISLTTLLSIISLYLMLIMNFNNVKLFLIYFGYFIFFNIPDNLLKVINNDILYKISNLDPGKIFKMCVSYLTGDNNLNNVILNFNSFYSSIIYSIIISIVFIAINYYLFTKENLNNH